MVKSFDHVVKLALITHDLLIRRRALRSFHIKTRQKPNTPTSQAMKDILTARLTRYDVDGN